MKPSPTMLRAVFHVKYPDKIALQYIRQHVNQSTPIICAGSITTVEAANKALDYGADLVAIGRAAIGNVRLPEYFSKGEALPFHGFLHIYVQPIDTQGYLYNKCTIPFREEHMNSSYPLYLPAILLEGIACRDPLFYPYRK